MRLVSEMQERESERYAAMTPSPIVVYVMQPSPYFREGTRSSFSIEWGGIDVCGSSALDQGGLEQVMLTEARILGEQGIYVIVHGKTRGKHSKR